MNYFRPDYFGAGPVYSRPVADTHFRSWREISEGIKKTPSFEVVSGSIGSRKMRQFGISPHLTHSMRRLWRSISLQHANSDERCRSLRGKILIAWLTYFLVASAYRLAPGAMGAEQTAIAGETAKFA